MREKVSLLLFLLGEVLTIDGANYCGPDTYHGKNGTIKTHPKFYSKNVFCLWTIQPQNNAITTIKILKTDFGTCSPKFPCCLSVRSEDLSRNYFNACREMPEDPVTLSVRGNKTFIFLNVSQNVETLITFTTRDIGECHHSEFQCFDKSKCYNSTSSCKGDFVCKDHSDKVNCGSCPINLTPCDHKSTSCFDPISERCDKVIQCPKGEDELDCTQLCPNAIRCPDSRKCIRKDQVCNNKADCADGFDEKNCSNSSSIYFVLIFIISGACSACFLWTAFKWVSKRRRNRARFLDNPPDFPLAPFEGPGDQVQETSSSEVFTDADFRQGGGVFEGYMQSVKKTRSSRTIPTKEQMSYMNLNGDDELIVLASLNVPVEICVGLTLSTEKANLCEALENGKLSLSKLNLTSNQCVLTDVTENQLEPSSRSSGNSNSRKATTASNSSDWTDIDDTSYLEANSKVIFVKSATNTTNQTSKVQ